MGTVVHTLRRGVELFLAPFDLLPPWLGLTLISIITGVLMLLVVGKTTPQRFLERARDRMAAAVYEVRLYLDSPLRVVRAQGRLLGNGALYIGSMMPALLIMMLPLGLLYLHMDLRYGFEPLQVGEQAVVRVSLDEGVNGAEFELPNDLSGIAITAPPVYDQVHQLLYLRMKVTEPGTHQLRFSVGGTEVVKQVSADPCAVAVSPARGRGVDMFVVEGHEPPLTGAVRAITIPHPNSSARWLWMPWWLFWLVIATVAALALKRPFGVVL